MENTTRWRCSNAHASLCEIMVLRYFELEPVTQIGLFRMGCLPYTTSSLLLISESAIRDRTV